jgi:hypothetical protein
LTQSKKWEIFKITQENQALIKRLNDRQSFYNTKTWEKDYDKKQKIKKNICMFPSVDFLKRDDSVTRSQDKLPQFNKTDSSMSFKKFKVMNIVTNKSNMEKSRDEKDKALLHIKKTIIGELLNCIVKFIIQNKK